MTLVDIVVSGLHLLLAALWAGSVFFLTFAVLPLARDGTIDSEPLARLTGRFKWIARTGALVTLLTGAYQASTGYEIQHFLESTRGHLVVGMVVLWVALAALSEIGAARLAEGTAENKVRTPAAQARPFLLAASLVAVALLVDAGALAASW